MHPRPQKDVHILMHGTWGYAAFFGKEYSADLDMGEIILDYLSGQ